MDGTASWGRVLGTAAIVLALLPSLALAASVQEELDPTVNDWLTYPTAIHAGICENPSPQPAFSLGIAEPSPELVEEVVEDFEDEVRDELPEREMVPPPVLIDDFPTVTLNTTIDAALQELIAAPHAILVYERAGDLDTLVACGEVEGSLALDQIIVNLHPIDDSGHAGTVLLDDEEGGVYVRLHLNKNVAFVTAVPIELRPGEIVLQPEIPSGPTHFIIFNGSLDQDYHLVIRGQGIVEVLESEVRPGETEPLNVILPPGVYMVSCPECGSADRPVTDRLIVTDAAPDPAPQAAPPGTAVPASSNRLAARR